MRRQVIPALVAFLALTVLTGIVYPLVVTGVAQVVFPNRADGWLVERDGDAVGSRLIGQPFAEARYFHPRPSAAGEGYDGMSSSASNLGPTNEELLTAIRERVDGYRDENGLDPADGRSRPTPSPPPRSGLDPHISPENARLQAERVAESAEPRRRGRARPDRRAHGRALARLPRGAGSERPRAQPRADQEA